MFKKMLILFISLGALNYIYADDYNDPNVNSLAASNQQFPDQDKLTGEKGKKYNASATGKHGNNNPTVNSLAASSQQFPQQDSLTGKKKEKYYTPAQMQQKSNNPNVNSRLSSANMFPGQNNFGSHNKNSNQKNDSTTNGM